jgi:hypothetical protein
MPNHVTNILTVKGTNEKVAEVIKVLMNDNEEVTFDNFFPMPEELRNTTSPTKIVSQKEYDSEKSKLETKLANGEQVWSTSLPITSKMQTELIKKHGADNWYDWAVANWGTKWGAYSGYAISEDSVFFQTAWSTPYKAMVKLSELYPDVEITIAYADEDFGHNVGEYTLKGGEEINSDVPEGGSMDAMRMALDIIGGEDYYLGDNIYEMSEDDIHDSWYNKFLHLILEKEYVDEEYPTFVNEYLLEQAVEDERFEYASKLRDILKVEN